MTTAPHGTKLTLDEYLALDIEGVWELADGELYEMPPPNVDHQELIGFLYRMVCAYLDGTTPRVGRALLGVGVALSDAMMLIPDMAFVRSERRDVVRTNYIYGIPDLVVEVLSTDRRRDLALKRTWYAEAGIPEYWIIDSYNDRLTVLALSGAEYVDRALLGPDDILTTPMMPGSELALNGLFANPDRMPASTDR